MPDATRIEVTAPASSSAPLSSITKSPTYLASESPTPIRTSPSGSNSRKVSDSFLPSSKQPLTATKRSSISSVHPEPTSESFKSSSHHHTQKRSQHTTTDDENMHDLEDDEPATGCCLPWFRSKNPRTEKVKELLKSLEFTSDDVLKLRANFQELKHIYTTPADNMFHLDIFVKRFYNNFMCIDEKARELFNGQPSFWLIKHLSGMVFSMITLIDKPRALLKKVRGVAPQHVGMNITHESFIAFRKAFVYTTMQSFLLQHPMNLEEQISIDNKSHQMSSHTDCSEQLQDLKQQLKKQMDKSSQQDDIYQKFQHALDGATVWEKLLEITSRVIVFYMGRVTDEQMDVVKNQNAMKNQKYGVK